MPHSTDHHVTWVKSSYSNGGGGDCVEWAPDLATQGTVPVRDSKISHGANLTFAPATWTTFTTALNSGDLDAS
ncbi:DUF397 domain-containing protein [Streptomyces sp. AJS327]|uniref:DUF397 domain-containing protein n=1 Tax=Streptomyces sp. AJS327 TaxID=2545265 RepID=UPI0015DF9C74|nr:DUF397 domain-containing protein [Streptomyces sp. AJS327]MBA0050181.1 DUF397 domain-containing protein [Streptomyces sp. AJS327]